MFRERQASQPTCPTKSFFSPPGKTLLGLLLQPRGDEDKQHVPLLAHSLRWGANLFFTQGEGRGVSRGQAREVV